MSSNTTVEQPTTKTRRRDVVVIILVILAPLLLGYAYAGCYYLLNDVTLGSTSATKTVRCYPHYTVAAFFLPAAAVETLVTGRRTYVAGPYNGQLLIYPKE
jgi:hypothetical protein